MPCPATRQQEARAIVRTAAPIASAAALTAQPLAACPLRVQHILCRKSPEFVIARRPKADVAISQYPAESWESHRRNRNCLPEIAPQGHFLALRAQGATSACGLLAMTNLWLSPFYRRSAVVGSAVPGPAVRSPTMTSLLYGKGRDPFLGPRPYKMETR